MKRLYLAMGLFVGWDAAAGAVGCATRMSQSLIASQDEIVIKRRAVKADSVQDADAQIEQSLQLQIIPQSLLAAGLELKRVKKGKIEKVLATLSKLDSIAFVSPVYLDPKSNSKLFANGEISVKLAKDFDRNALASALGGLGWKLGRGVGSPRIRFWALENQSVKTGILKAALSLEALNEVECAEPTFEFKLEHFEQRPIQGHKPTPFEEKSIRNLLGK